MHPGHCTSTIPRSYARFVNVCVERVPSQSGAVHVKVKLSLGSSFCDFCSSGSFSLDGRRKERDVLGVEDPFCVPTLTEADSCLVTVKTGEFCRIAARRTLGKDRIRAVRAKCTCREDNMTVAVWERNEFSIRS